MFNTILVPATYSGKSNQEGLSPVNFMSHTQPIKKPKECILRFATEVDELSTTTAEQHFINYTDMSEYG